MASAQRKGPKTYYRCARCHALIPISYKACTECGHDHRKWQGSFITHAKRTFPGSYEVDNPRTH